MSLIDRVGLRGPRMKYWFLYVAVFYVAWAAIVWGFDLWPEIEEHWPISLVMIFGSLVAGSTPMGGGTVAFPFLVLVFDQPPSLGRNFGLAIQALGMTSAMIFIFCRGVPIQRMMLMWTSIGAAAGVAFGTFVIAPILQATIIKLIFSCLWMSFAILTLSKNSEICGFTTKPVIDDETAMRLGIGVGIAGGITTALIGVGVEMLLYTALVLLFRADLKVAVPTAVSAMAVASVMGTGIHLAIGDIEREVWLNWLAAGPIVVFGAPAGTFIVSVIPRIRTLYFVSVLCVVQFVWTLYQVKPSPGEWVFVAISLALAVLGFNQLYQIGKNDGSVSVAVGQVPDMPR